MDPYRELPHQEHERRSLLSRAADLVPRPVSLVVAAGALGWPAFFVGHLLWQRAPWEKPAAVAPSCAAEISGSTSPAAPEKSCAAEVAAAREETRAESYTENPVDPEEEADRLSANAARASVGRAARAVVEALDRRDFAAVASHVRESEGLAIATEASLLDEAPHLSRQRLRACAGQTAKQVWLPGADPRTCATFVADVTKLGTLSGRVHVSFNGADAESVVIRRTHEDAVVVRFHEPGTEGDCQSNGIPDRTLRLVFVPEGEAWRLMAMIGS